MTPQEFYKHVADIFRTDYDYVEPATGNTKKRWDRRLGNGRFEGRGIVRFFSPTMIHIALTKPELTATYHDAVEALKAIERAEARRCVLYWFEMGRPSLNTETYRKVGETLSVRVHESDFAELIGKKESK